MSSPHCGLPQDFSDFLNVLLVINKDNFIKVFKYTLISFLLITPYLGKTIVDNLFGIISIESSS